jgi:hypothetical protein
LRRNLKPTVLGELRRAEVAGEAREEPKASDHLRV